MRKIKPPFTVEPAESAGDVAFFSCYIAGEPWRYALVTKQQMKILAEDTGHDGGGLCDGNANIIYISETELTHPIVIHELCHAHMQQSQTHSAALSADQVEEVMCDTFAYNWFKIIMIARVMVYNLQCYLEHQKGNRDQDWQECPPDIIDNRFPEKFLDLCATYATGGANPLLRASIRKKKRKARSKKP